MNTPWGPSQFTKEIAPGIIRVDTASHGGFILDESRMAEFNARLTIHFSPFAGYSYFEEDCDWAAVALAFPELFTDREIYHAVKTADYFRDRTPERAYDRGWLNVIAWLTDTEQGRQVSSRAAAYVEA